MCNLYSLTKGQAAIVEFTQAMKDSTGNLPSLPGIFPDYKAPVVANRGGIRELCMMRWGMPTSSLVQMQATQKRAAKLDAKGAAYDFKELLRLDQTRGQRTSVTRPASTGSAGSGLRTDVWSRSHHSASSTRPKAGISGLR